LNYVDTYFKYRERYGWKRLGESFANMFFPNPKLHKNQRKLADETDDIKAARMINRDYSHLNESFDGSIYEETINDKTTKA
jgi:hypothetical protein